MPFTSKGCGLCACGVRAANECIPIHSRVLRLPFVRLLVLLLMLLLVLLALLDFAIAAQLPALITATCW